MRAVTIALCALFVLEAASAQAQRVSIDLSGKTVTLVATNATLDDILAEWSRIGGLKVVSLKGGVIGGAPITMVLKDVTERQALEMLLRDLSGYILSARHDQSTGLSAFEQILILPTSTPAPSSGVRPVALIPSAPDGPPSFVAPATMRTDPDVASVGPADEALAGLPGAESAGAADSAAAPPSNAGQPINAAQRPPTPLLPPSTAPDANNPFGRAPGSSRPGTVVSPPPGVLYPPVTNPNAGGGFKPAGTP